jgi:hypothetical protein
MDFGAVLIDVNVNLNAAIVAEFCGTKSAD